jgi:uroporphyrin-III C-methyltransferase / precorrin-2 dehydrogenase / sirohydrochlorin ferrochelatase
MTYHVLPTETRPARLAMLAKLPIFLELRGKRAIVAGGADAVIWKAELLAAAGAEVAIFAEDASPELLSLVHSQPAITLIGRAWRADDFVGAQIAVGNCASREEAEQFAAAARRHGVLVNVIDQPAFCDFQFGTIVNRSPVVVGISTDGAAPILGQAIRRRIEAILPASLGAWGAAAKAFRDRLKTIVPSGPARRRFWEKFVDVTFISQADEDAQLAALERLARETLAEKAERAPVGEVVIVGAGPGDPELLTMKAVRELQAADAIVYDRLVAAGVLELGRREARRIHVGKEGHGMACRQQDISALLVDLALEGKRVVRLKGGDPAIFGRTGEEAAACKSAGVPVRIVPGVTAASAAAASFGVSLTHRAHAQRLQFVTGHDRHGELPPDLDLDALSDPRATTVVYMGRRTIATLAGEMLARGLHGATPAVVVSNVSRPQEHRTVTTLERLSFGAVLGDDGAPTLVMIGAALAQPVQSPGAAQPAARVSQALATS